MTGGRPVLGACWLEVNPKPEFQWAMEDAQEALGPHDVDGTEHPNDPAWTAACAALDALATTAPRESTRAILGRFLHGDRCPLPAVLVAVLGTKKIYQKSPKKCTKNPQKLPPQKNFPPSGGRFFASGGAWQRALPGEGATGAQTRKNRFFRLFF